MSLASPELKENGSTTTLKKSASGQSLSGLDKSKKIVENINKSIAEKKPFYSFEYFPPKTPEGVQNLYTRIDRMCQLDPMFIDLTWGAGGTTADLTLEICDIAQNTVSCDVMMHLTCTNMPKESIAQALESARKSGVRNILALRGDPPKGTETFEMCEGGFANAVDLVKYIRELHGDYFGIAVAGYPEGHIQAESLDKDIQYLKEKVDAGADFIITQLFYDVDLFVEWMKKVRDVGVKCPIIPGIMPIQNYNGFIRMTGFCKTFVPKEISDELEAIKDDDAKVKDYGVALAAKMSRQLLEAGCPGLHFYTLNLEKSVFSILETLGWISSRVPGVLPWKQSVVTKRKKEDVRPIFWANRPKSYMDRTSSWDEFPNGRWGDAASPAFGDLNDYHLCSFKTGKKEDRRKMWGSSISQPLHVFEVFEKYIDGAVSMLPWCEFSLASETVPLRDLLRKINKAGYLTINSQPRVNAADSADTAVGWGGPGGFVYQKAYLEFFTSAANLERFVKAIEEKGLKSFRYNAMNVKGERVTNLKLNDSHVTAVTWGVFPDKEIMQPTVVDAKAFSVWKDEAFALWKSQWQGIYEENSDSWHVIEEMHDTYYLVNVVDNDYINGDIFSVFEKLI